jgi:hypothetical protein
MAVGTVPRLRAGGVCGAAAEALGSTLCGMFLLQPAEHSQCTRMDTLLS